MNEVQGIHDRAARNKIWQEEDQLNVSAAAVKEALGSLSDNSSHTIDTFAVDDVAEAKFSTFEGWWRGKITGKDTATGTYSILYDDGDKSSDVNP